MPTSPISKPSAVKRTLPIKWRDSAWSARISIRSLYHRRWERGVRLPDGELGNEEVRACAFPGWGRAGEPLPGGRIPLPNLPFPLAHPRFFRPTGMDNLI